MTNTTRNWKTTTMGILIILGYVSNALLAFLQTGALPSIEAATLAIGSGIGLIMAKDGDKSGVVRLLILAPACLMLVSCSTDPAGNKTFFGVTSASFQDEAKAIALQIAEASGKAAAQAALDVAEMKLNELQAKEPDPTANPIMLMARGQALNQAQKLVDTARLKVASFSFRSAKHVVDVQPL